MPTYDYQCRGCGTVTEVIHPMAEDGPSVCDLCGGALRRVIHPAGIIFKGSGFYRNDSRASGSSSVSGGDSRSKESKPSGNGEGASSTAKADTSSGGTSADSKSSQPAKDSSSSSGSD